MVTHSFNILCIYKIDLITTRHKPGTATTTVTTLTNNILLLWQCNLLKLPNKLYLIKYNIFFVLLLFAIIVGSLRLGNSIRVRGLNRVSNVHVNSFWFWRIRVLVKPQTHDLDRVSESRNLGVQDGSLHFEGHVFETVGDRYFLSLESVISWEKIH